MSETALERFLRYARMDTTSDEASGLSPSSPGQWKLGECLRDEMAALGLKNVLLDEHCYAYGLIPASVRHQPTIALIAHMDTVAAVPGRAFSPRVARYSGQPLALNEKSGVFLSEADFPALSQYRGQELVVTDGTTVLGADDKAGIAEIMTLAQKLTQDPAIPHGDIWLVFTPDEEIGSGADLLDLTRIQADFAYTVDGGALNILSYETFNAASASVRIKGRNIHPGSAKGRMKNAATIAMRFHSLLPPKEIPEETEGYEGFYHLNMMTGEEEEASLSYILRDHDADKLEEKKRRMLWRQRKSTASSAAAPLRFRLRIPTATWVRSSETILISLSAPCAPSPPAACSPRPCLSAAARTAPGCPSAACPVPTWARAAKTLMASMSSCRFRRLIKWLRFW